MYLWAQKSSEYPNLITVTLHTNWEGVTLASTSLRDGPRIVKFNDYGVDVEPSDRWGWWPASTTSTSAVCMKVGRLSPRGQAMMVLGLEDPVPPAVMQEIRGLPPVNSAQLVEL